MPAEKGEVDPLLGQTFFKHFKVEYSTGARKLSLKKLDTTGVGRGRDQVCGGCRRQALCQGNHEGQAYRSPAQSSGQEQATHTEPPICRWRRRSGTAGRWRRP